MRDIAGLSIIGFKDLCDKFSHKLQNIKQEQYEKEVQSGKRKREIDGSVKGKLKTIQIKLLFILMYFKCYPTMDIMELFFDLDKSNVKHNIDNLTTILKKALGKSLSLPKKNIYSFGIFRNNSKSI